jgi:hypothetical protein
MNTQQAILSASRTAFLFLLVIVSAISTELLIVAYRGHWYEKQDHAIRPACESLQPGMSPTEVWELVGKLVEPHVIWQTENTLGFAATQGSCSVSLEPNTHKVVAREFSRPAEGFVGVR